MVTRGVMIRLEADTSQVVMRKMNVKLIELLLRIRAVLFDLGIKGPIHSQTYTNNPYFRHFK